MVFMCRFVLKSPCVLHFTFAKSSHNLCTARFLSVKALPHLLKASLVSQDSSSDTLHRWWNLHAVSAQGGQGTCSPPGRSRNFGRFSSRRSIRSLCLCHRRCL